MDNKHIKDILFRRKDTLASLVLDTLEHNPKGMKRVKLVTAVTSWPWDQTSDRRVRKAIKRLRDLGLVILSSTQSSGYRLAGPEDTAAVQAYADQQMRAAKSRMATARKVQKAYGLRNVVPMDLSG